MVRPNLGYSIYKSSMDEIIITLENFVVKKGVQLRFKLTYHR